MKHPLILSWSDEDQTFIAFSLQLNGCVAHGNTPAEALAAFEETTKEWFRSAAEMGWEIPQPICITPDEPVPKSPPIHFYDDSVGLGCS